MADEKKKVDKTSEKEAAKAKKKAAEALIKEKRKELKKAPKEGKEGNVLQRAAKAIAKFFKDFRGTVKKIIWPDRKSVIKNTLVVFAVVIVVGIGVWVVDFALSESVKLVGAQLKLSSRTARKPKRKQPRQKLQQSPRPKPKQQHPQLTKQALPKVQRLNALHYGAAAAKTKGGKLRDG